MKGLKDLFIGTNVNIEESIRELLDSSYQGVKRLFVLVYNNTDNDENH